MSSYKNVTVRPVAGVQHFDTKLLTPNKINTPKVNAPARVNEKVVQPKLPKLPMQQTGATQGIASPKPPRVKQITARIWPLKRQQIRAAGVKPPKNDEGDLE